MKVDKRITAALIFAILVQTASALVWAGHAAERLVVVEREVEANRGSAERLARVETELKAMRNQLDRIERKIDKP